jgi:cytochrome c oxidase subunit 2
MVHAVGVLVAVAGIAAACGGDAPEPSPPAQSGREVAQKWGCASCHSPNGETRAGPTWEGIWGTTVELTDGRTVTVDDDYVTRSIREPDAEVVDGFAPAMPTFNLSDAEIDDVIAYIRSLGAAG